MPCTRLTIRLPVSQKYMCPYASTVRPVGFDSTASVALPPPEEKPASAPVPATRSILPVRFTTF